MLLQWCPGALPATGDMVNSTHSLQNQSRCDLTGRDHVDGWGVAFYRNQRPLVQKSATAAASDEQFVACSQAAKSRLILAHVRRASKGPRRLENSHPFTRGRWTFAHNGTLTALDSLRDKMFSELTAVDRKSITGETDSELIFYWLLRRMERSHAITGDRCVRLSRMRSVMATSIAELDRRNQSAERDRNKIDPVAKLNFLLTNGSVVVASRFRNSLHILQRAFPSNANLHNCVVIASEPTTTERWAEVPDASVLSISTSGQLTIESIRHSEMV